MSCTLAFTLRGNEINESLLKRIKLFMHYFFYFENIMSYFVFLIRPQHVTFFFLPLNIMDSQI